MKEQNVAASFKKTGFPAHVLKSSEGYLTQDVIDHCRKTAEYAHTCLQSIGLGNVAYLAGLMHDLGKCTKASKKYQEGVARGENLKRGSVIHTFQCCRFFLEEHSDEYETCEDITRELLAFSASAHHGLYDCYDESRMSGFMHRIDADGTDYESAKEVFLNSCGGDSFVRDLFRKAEAELDPLYSRIENDFEDTGINASGDESEKRFYIACIARLLLSAVIEGDRRDTAEFMSAAVFRNWPENMKDIWSTLLKNTEDRIDMFPCETPIQKARREISVQCRNAAEGETGIYRLNVPTGSGKTISSLRFALAHAKKWNKRRIIFTSPLLSILEQNAEVWKEYIGDSSLILEHHSNVINTEECEESTDGRELLLENWDVPVVITTMVQLLNTLFLGKTTSVRRYWSLCDSVIVIDEVQTVPNHMLSLFNLSINFLARYCNATVILCSATQPCLEAARHPIIRNVKDIVPYNQDLWSSFSRTELIDAGKIEIEKIPEFALKKIQDTNSLLIVCNKTAQAAYLYNQLSQYSHIKCFHMSAKMCVADRKSTLKKVEKALAETKSSETKVICVSTQVIEAGVDISFGAVIRFTAGIDNIIQTAGRCNRNGESSVKAPAFIVTCIGENLRTLKEIQMYKDSTAELLYSYKHNPEKFHDDLASDEAVEFYYRTLYRNMPVDYQDFPLPGRPSVYSLLSDNVVWSEDNNDEYCLTQAFKTAGELFRVFDDESETAVAPYGKGKELIEQLNGQKYISLSYLKWWLKEIQPYTVSFYEYQKENLKMSGMYQIAGVWILQDIQYREGLGIITDTSNSGYLEV